jgi:hypothetical protein
MTHQLVEHSILQQLLTIPLEATAILESYRLANTYASQGKECASKAVAEALRCGAMMLTQKQFIGHGKWTKWRETYLSEISDSNAKDWMRLAKRVRAPDLLDTGAVPALNDTPVVGDVSAQVIEASSLRAAYKMILLPPAERKKLGKSFKIKLNVVDLINKFRGHKLIAPLLVEENDLVLGLGVAELLKAALEPLAKLYQRL